MFYYGYCDMCNYLDADLNRQDVFDNLQDHQVAKHPTIDGEDPLAIHIVKVPFPFRVWLTVKTSASFWEAWRHRKQPAYVLARLSQIVP